MLWVMIDVTRLIRDDVVHSSPACLVLEFIYTLSDSRGGLFKVRRSAGG